MASGFGLLVFNPKQEREAKLLRNIVLKHFQYLEDPRADRGRNPSLVSIITIAILAVLTGADGFAAIEAYGQAKQSWLETFLDLPKGIPSHDTFGRVLRILEPKQLQSGFRLLDRGNHREIRPLAKIKNLPLGEESGASSQESGELRMSINQLNALFRDFRQFYVYFSHFCTLEN